MGTQGTPRGSKSARARDMIARSCASDEMITASIRSRSSSGRSTRTSCMTSSRG